MPTVASMSYARMADATDTSITTRCSFSSSECRKVPNDNFAQSIEQKWTKNGGPLRGGPHFRSFWPSAFGQRPKASGLRPKAEGLRPAFGLRPKAEGLRPEVFSLECGGKRRTVYECHAWSGSGFGRSCLRHAHPVFRPKIPLFCTPKTA